MKNYNLIITVDIVCYIRCLGRMVIETLKIRKRI